MTTSADVKLFKAADGVDLVYRQWLPDGEARATVQIVHGASERSGRYGRMAAALTARGFAVYAMDLRGHGRTAQCTGVGRFGQGNAETMLDDVLTLRRIAEDAHPGHPVILLGHSMGSVIALASAERACRSCSSVASATRSVGRRPPTSSPRRPDGEARPAGGAAHLPRRPARGFQRDQPRRGRRRPAHLARSAGTVR